VSPSRSGRERFVNALPGANADPRLSPSPMHLRGSHDDAAFKQTSHCIEITSM
jgi:hypothetical protein